MSIHDFDPFRGFWGSTLCKRLLKHITSDRSVKVFKVFVY